MTEYYLINSLAYLFKYSNTAAYRGYEYGKYGHLSYFHLLEAVNNAFEVQFFSGLHFYTLSKTLITCTHVGPCSSNNAFKGTLALVFLLLAFLFYFIVCRQEGESAISFRGNIIDCWKVGNCISLSLSLSPE